MFFLLLARFFTFLTFFKFFFGNVFYIYALRCIKDDASSLLALRSYCCKCSVWCTKR